jgi:hypothetical protein
MAKKASEAKKIKFAVEEIILSFVGALVLTFGIVVTVAGGMANFILGIFIIWLGLLLFTVPMIRKIEQLM